MAQSADHYKKYQVYFFLYLAVICELLIIIVERDDAEADLLKQQRALEEKNRRIILELLKNMPAVAAAGDNQLKVNETRFFTVRVKGLGDKDEVTTPPTVHVYKDGTEIQTLKYPDNIRDSSLQSTTGERVYRFDWKADKGAGKFEFWVEAGTNRIELRPELGKDATVKVGSLDFTRGEIQKAIDFDPTLKGTPLDHFIQRSESLDPAKFVVDVISESFDQLQIQADRITTAVGFPMVNEIKVRGTTVDKVSGMNVNGGGRTLGPNDPNNPFRSDDPARGKWVWTNTFNEPGDKTITIDARDNRGAGALSVSRPITFNVSVKQPVLARPRPRGAFVGESFEMSINVAGLEDVGSYTWQLLLDNQTVDKGTGNVIKYRVPADAIGKSMRIKAEYMGRTYNLLPDSSAKALVPSEFAYTVSAPIEQIGGESFSTGNEYPINNVFQFQARRCGRCTPGNIKNVQPAEIRIEVESSDGQDLLDYQDIKPQTDPTSGNDRGTFVKFFLKGKVPKDGTEATIRVRFGTASKDYRVILMPAN